MNLSSRDRRLLRDLARRVAQIAADPVMGQRRQVIEEIVGPRPALVPQVA